MHTFENVVDFMYWKLTVTLTHMYRDKTFILMSLTTTGFFQIFGSNADITVDLLFITIGAFCLSTALGLWKHIRTSEINWKVFAIKTSGQVLVTMGIILLGYFFAIFLYAASRMLVVMSFGVVQQSLPASSAAYVVFLGYAIVFLNNAIRSCDLLDQLFPGQVPAWFSAAFRKFRETGDYKDLLNITNSVKPKEGGASGDPS